MMIHYWMMRLDSLLEEVAALPTSVSSEDLLDDDLDALLDELDDLDLDETVRNRLVL